MCDVYIKCVCSKSVVQRYCRCRNTILDFVPRVLRTTVHVPRVHLYHVPRKKVGKKVPISIWMYSTQTFALL